MWITLEQIQCLQSVKESGSINAASENLNKAKSAIRYSIQKLEEQLGFEVLDRTGYRMAMTPQGEAFLNKAKKLLQEHENLKEEIHKIATGIEMKIGLSATAIYPTKKLNKILKELMLKFPQTEFRFHREILSGEKMLKRGEVDIAIFENITDTINLDYKKIGSIDLKLVISSDHPFLQLPKSKQKMPQLLKYPHIIQRSTIPDASDIGISDESKRWTVSDIDSKKELILSHLGWGRLPDHFVDNDIKKGKLVHLKTLKYDHSLNIFISKQREKAFGPVLKFLWDSFQTETIGSK